MNGSSLDAMLYRMQTLDIPVDRLVEELPLRAALAAAIFEPLLGWLR